MHKELTPNQFLTQCTGKPIFMYAKAVAEVSLPVQITKSALKRGFKAGDNSVTTVRYTETSAGFFIMLVY